MSLKTILVICSVMIWWGVCYGVYHCDTQHQWEKMLATRTSQGIAAGVALIVYAIVLGWVIWLSTMSIQGSGGK